MQTLNLETVWQILNTLSFEQTRLSEEEDKYVSLLGRKSSYYNLSFEEFLNYYSFKIEDDNIIVFNNDGVPYEDYLNNDFSYLPTILLSFSAEKLDRWIKTEIELQLAQQEREKLAEKENIKETIKLLEKRLETL